MSIKTAIAVGVLVMSSHAYNAIAQEASPAPATTPPAATTAPATAPAATTAPATAPATAAPATPDERLGAVKQSLQASKVALKSYEWVETTTLSLKGEEKVRQQYRVYYGAEGTEQKVPLAPDAKEDKKRGLRGKAVESKKAEMQAAMKDAVALLHEYAPLDPAKIQAAKDAGNLSVSSPAPDGTVSVTIKNYLKAGDQVAISLDAAKNTLKGFSISSYVGDAAAKEKSPVAAQVTFGTLPDGTVYTAKETLDLSAQSLKVATENTGYKKQG